jgi:hypothetical protein
LGGQAQDLKDILGHVLRDEWLGIIAVECRLIAERGRIRARGCFDQNGAGPLVRAEATDRQVAHVEVAALRRPAAIEGRGMAWPHTEETIGLLQEALRTEDEREPRLVRIRSKPTTKSERPSPSKSPTPRLISEARALGDGNLASSTRTSPGS